MAHVLADALQVGVLAAEVARRVFIAAAEVLVQPPRGALVEARRLDDQVVGRRIAHHLPAVGHPLARDLPPDEFLVEEAVHLFQVHPVRHLADQVGGADHAADGAVALVVDANVVDVHLVAGEMHQARRERRLAGEADPGQITGEEVRAAADVHLGEHGAVVDLGF